MPVRSALPEPSLDLSIVVKAPARRVLAAFFEPASLHAWWQVIHAVTTPRLLGPYAVEWPPTDFRDEILGRLGGVFRGTVMRFDPAGDFFVADCFWLPPDGDPIGPMALEVRCHPIELKPEGNEGRTEVATRIHLYQNGFEESARWRRYYDIARVGWERALAAMKTLLEEQEREQGATGKE